jgi:hypothetical protein
MNLAPLFLIGALAITSTPLFAEVMSRQAQNQETPSTAATPAGQSAAQTSQAPVKPKPAPKRVRRKKPASSACDSQASASMAPADPPPPGKASAQNSTAAAPKNCPPPKIVVRQGGSSEPSIRLAGGPSADEAARKRNAINQLLEVTDQNLKKSAGMQLTANQQDSITQMRQFMEQSKQAMADGDLERARTLAWKAEVLSEDLVNPQK